MSATHKLSLAVQYATGAEHLPTRAQFRRWIKAALQRDVQIVLRIVDEAEGRELNKNFRGKDYATNVLTFAYDDTDPQPRQGGVNLSGAGGAAGRLLPQSAGSAITSDLASVIGSPSRMASGSTSNVSQPLTGDIVICAPVVEKEASAQHKELHAHYAHLTIHAALHLQGYDHENDRDAAAMEACETALLAKLGYADPYQVVT